MKKIEVKTKQKRRVQRVRKNLVVSPDKPRLSVFRSNKYIYAQIIDISGNTITSALGSKSVKDAFEVGKSIAKKALEKKVKSVVFDRSGYRYHGRIKSLADGAREGGLKF